jgi:hypothetical protein
MSNNHTESSNEQILPCRWRHLCCKVSQTKTKLRLHKFPEFLFARASSVDADNALERRRLDLMTNLIRFNPLFDICMRALSKHHDDGTAAEV